MGPGTTGYPTELGLNCLHIHLASVAVLDKARLAT